MSWTLFAHTRPDCRPDPGTGAGIVAAQHRAARCQHYRHGLLGLIAGLLLATYWLTDSGGTIAGLIMVWY